MCPKSLENQSFPTIPTSFPPYSKLSPRLSLPKAREMEERKMYPLSKKLLAAALSALCFVSFAAAQKDDKKNGPSGTPVLWEPSDVASYNTTLGPLGDLQP